MFTFTGIPRLAFAGRRSDGEATVSDLKNHISFKVGKLVKLAREIPKWAQKGLRTEFDKWGATVQLVRERNQDEEAASMAQLLP